jgi:uncharacterized membrane protein
MGLRRWPWFVQTPVGAAWGIVIGVPAALPNTDGATVAGVLPTASGMADLVRGLFTSWVDVISLDPPLGRYGDVLVPVFVLTYLGGWAAVAGSLRGSRVPGAVAPVGLLVYGIVFGPGVGSHTVAVGVGMLVVAVAWAQAVRRRGQGVDRGHTRRLRVSSARRAVTAVVFVLVCAVAGAGLTQLIQGPERTVARHAFEARFEPDHAASPLQSYRSWVAGEAEDRTVATISGARSGDMLRVAVLDDYDGVAFRVAPDRAHGFTRLPSTVDRAAGPRETVRVRLAAPLNPWLPLVGSLESLDLDAGLRDRLYYDRDRDAALVRDGVKAGTSYTLRSVPSAPAATAGLERLRPGRVHRAQLPVLPESLVAAAEKATQDERTPGEKLQAVLSMLQSGYVSHADEGEVFSRSGHSAGRLDALVDEDPMVGDAEQYAAAFAVLARQEGFASRVVLGFVDTDGDGTLRGGELTAWVEVDDADRGWVAVDPNPEPRPVDEQHEVDQDAVSLPRTVLPPDPPDLEDVSPPAAENSRPPSTDRPEAWRNNVAVIWWWTWRIGLGLLVVTAPWWGLILFKAARCLRRRGRDRRHVRVTGAWSEVVDRAVDAGHTPVAGATRSEVARSVASDDVTGGRGEGLVGRLESLAARADRLAFSPQGPDRSDVDDVWKETRAVSKQLRAAPSKRSARWRRRFSWRSVGLLVSRVTAAGERRRGRGARRSRA